MLDFFYDDAILCPTTECVDEMNKFILSLTHEEQIIYLSSYTPYQ